MSRMNAYAPRAPRAGLIPSRHDHTYSMIFTLDESRCTGCGARWMREPDPPPGRSYDAAWVCVDPGRPRP